MGSAAAQHTAACKHREVGHRSGGPLSRIRCLTMIALKAPRHHDPSSMEFPGPTPFTYTSMVWPCLSSIKALGIAGEATSSLIYIISDTALLVNSPPECNLAIDLVWRWGAAAHLIGWDGLETDDGWGICQDP